MRDYYDYFFRIYMFILNLYEYNFLIFLIKIINKPKNDKQNYRITKNDPIQTTNIIQISSFQNEEYLLLYFII